MQIQCNDPRDEIRIGVLCPASAYKGLCSQRGCAENGGNCTLSGAPWATFCKIPQSHPVSEAWRAIAAAQAEARKNLQ